MAKSGSQRVNDYRRGKAHINIWVDIETKKRFVEIATSYQLSQSEFFEKLIASGPVIPIPEKKRVMMEKEEALALLKECNGDYEMAIHKLIKKFKAINPNFVYNKRPFETSEQEELRKKFRRIRSKLLNWKKKPLFPVSSSIWPPVSWKAILFAVFIQYENFRFANVFD